MSPRRRTTCATRADARADLFESIEVVGRRREHTLRRLEQHILGPLAAEEAVDRDEPVRQTPAVLGVPEHHQDGRQRLQGL